MIGENDIYTAAKLFQPARLTLARELRGHAKSELADKIDKSASAIGQFESGRARPDAQTVRELSLALGLPLTFFTRPLRTAPVPVEQCHFRSLRSASQKERRRLIAQGTILNELVSLLEERVELPREQVSAVARTCISVDDIESLAVEVRTRWGLGLGPIPNVMQLLEANGLLVLPIHAGSADVDAFSFWLGGRPCIFLVEHKDSSSRVRFDAGHELGHLVLHPDVVPGDPEMERQANRFASAFLLPKDSFLPECPTRLVWEHFLELKRRWKVSLAALFRRAYDLERITEASYRRAFMMLNRTGQRQHEACEPPIEKPAMIANAIGLISGELSFESIADQLGLSAADLAEAIRQ